MRIKRIILAIILTLGLAELSRAQTITALVAASGGEFDDDRSDFDILLNAVIAADLAETLDDPSLRVTVFAPTDAAFIRLARDLGYGGSDEGEAWGYLVEQLTVLGGGNPIPVLTQVLTYHVAPRKISPFYLFLLSIFRAEIDTLQGATIRPFFFLLIDKEPDLANPFLTRPINLRASNGVIHAITRVLIPLDLP